MIIQCPACSLRYDVSNRAPGTRARCRCGATFDVPAADEQSSRGVRCSGCGAQNSSSARQCAYCGAPMATVSCPSCLTLNPAHYKHCSACGSDLQAPARAIKEEHDKPLECPRCEKPLEARLLADTLVDQCTDCGGVFLDHEALGAVLNDRTRQAPLRERLLKLPSAGSLPNPREVVYLRCPECATLMARRNPAHRSGIIVDVCAAHGVWFDDRELAILMQLAASGAELNVSPKPNPLAGASAAGASGGSPIPGGSLPPMAERSRRDSVMDIDVNIGDLGELLGLIDRLF